MSWKKNSKSRTIKAPLKKELLTLRVMILIGLASTIYFLTVLLDKDNIGHPLFFWLLMSGIIYNCLQVLYEWYHYFSISVPETPETDKIYSVDILTTFCKGEPYEMIIETLEAIQNITYPHETYLGDEANDPFLIEECKRLGVHHVTRTNRINAKAGNINNILSQSKGELCIVLDPDHVPLPDFCDTIVPHFQDPEVGYVQIVQAYYNLGENLIAKGAAQQTFQFYGPMMMTMNSYGTVMAIGANCTFRRIALESIGGHAAGLAEDMHTAMQLHAKGWKSKYVPSVLTRGLVPTSLSAYYKQQLKWSRGVFELLVTSYPVLFKKFTWRQKLHYGFVPFHYLSGIFYFFNFLIPILALVFAVIPFKIDFVEFAIAGLPLFVSTLLIRHYVQRWVTEERERGFHVVGGLLLIGTWWIYIMGFFFTLIRRKVPYDPTPKDGSDPNNWGLNVPNIAVGVCSLSAIFYGLSIDYNPYSLFMSGVASLNCLFMVFVVAASRQGSIRRFKKKHRSVKATVDFLVPAKVEFYRFRHFIYSNMRKMALPLVLIVAATTLFYSKSAPVIHIPEEDKILPVQKDFLLKGAYIPYNTNGLSSVNNILKFEAESGTHMDIISLYLAWGNGVESKLPGGLLDSIYSHNSIPLISWEPWGSLFQNNKDINKENRILSKINEGLFDEYLFNTAIEFRNLQRPVFLRFAHEPDNPLYPWSTTGLNTPEDYKNAWKHVREQFKKAGAHNVIWVWNPWKARNAETYFPGYDQVDWLALTILNYDKYNDDGKIYSFEELYKPFLLTQPFKSDIPVMVAEMGSLNVSGKQGEWIRKALNYIKKDKSKIKAVVFFNSSFDLNVPEKIVNKLDWKIQNTSVIPDLLRSKVEGKPQYFIQKRLEAAGQENISLTNRDVFKECKGVNYTKGRFWFRNLHTLTSKELHTDFNEMKTLGINSIKIYGPSDYDKNILSVATKENLKVVYGFRIPEGTSFITDSSYLKDFSKTIISQIRKLKENENIIGWNISANAMDEASNLYYKPASLYHKYAYMKWLKALVIKVNAEDPDRPVTVDISANKYMMEDLAFLKREIPLISSFGIKINSDTTLQSSLKESGIPYFFTYVNPSMLKSLNDSQNVSFISDWQDTWSVNRITFDGLKDHWGKRKHEYYLTSTLWSDKPQILSEPIIPVKILKPPYATLPFKVHTYHALLKTNIGWELAKNVKEDTYKYKWYLIYNEKGKPKELFELGEDSYAVLKMPKDPHLFDLYLVVYNDKESKTIITPLNIWPEDAIEEPGQIKTD